MSSPSQPPPSSNAQPSVSLTNRLIRIAREVKVIINSYIKLTSLIFCVIIAAILAGILLTRESDKSLKVNEEIIEAPKVRFDVFFGEPANKNSSIEVEENLKEINKFCFSYAVVEDKIFCIISERVEHAKIEEVCGRNLEANPMKVGDENFDEVNEFLRQTFGFGYGSVLWFDGFDENSPPFRACLTIASKIRSNSYEILNEFCDSSHYVLCELPKNFE